MSKARIFYLKEFTVLGAVMYSFWSPSIFP